MQLHSDEVEVKRMKIKSNGTKSNKITEAVKCEMQVGESHK